MAPAATLVWFRAALRLGDHPALAAALAGGGPVIPVWILDEAGEGRWPLGGAARWWREGSLGALRETLRRRGADLVLRRGDSAAVLEALVRETGAGAVCWNRRIEPAARAQEAAVAARLRAAGVDIHSADAATLFPPGAVLTQSGGPFRVFTPFWQRCRQLAAPAPLPAPAGPWPKPERWPRSERLEDWWPGSDPGRAAGLAAAWTPGEAAAQRRLRTFLKAAVDEYDSHRDFPAHAGTSRLSPHLRFGELSARQVWAAVMDSSRDDGVQPRSRGAAGFLRELGWREFAGHCLWHFPQTPEAPLQEDFRDFPAQRDEKLLAAWREGRTGYPLVDAGMRELARTGWMHNRVRMVAASFLMKQLLQPWPEGAAWFWETLVDADLANNTLGWQWCAGCGADAAPYFRIFNPLLQQDRFDPEGAYVRRWVPETFGVSGKRKQSAPGAGAKATIVGKRPPPVVELAAGRERALKAYAEWRDRVKARAGGGR